MIPPERGERSISVQESDGDASVTSLAHRKNNSPGQNKDTTICVLMLSINWNLVI